MSLALDLAPVAARRERSPLLLASLAWAALAIGMMVRDYHRFDHQIGSTDDAMRLFQIHEWLRGAGWYGLFTDRFSPPTGYMPHWSRLIDVPIGGMILLFERFVSPARAEQLTLVIWPLIPLSGVFLGLTAIASRIGNAATPILMIAAAIGAASVHYIFAPGAIDHHNVQLMLSVGFIAFILDTDRGRLKAWLAGLCAALLLAVGFESLHIFILGTGFLLLGAVMRPHETPATKHVFLALGLGLSAVFLATTPPAAWLVPHCDALAFNSFAAVVIASLGTAAVLHRGMTSSPSARIGLLALVWLAAGLVFLAIDPVCRGGPLAELDPRLKPLWLDSVREAQPLSGLFDNPGKIVGFFAIPVLALLAAALSFWRGQAERRTVLLVGLVLSSLALSCLQIRFVTYAGWFGACLAAIAWSRLIGGPDVVAVLKRIALTVLLPYALIVLGDRAAKTVESAAAAPSEAAYQSCNDLRNLGAIAALPKGTILSHIDLGPYLLAKTEHRVIMGPYHRAAEAIVFGQTAFMGSALKAKEAILAHPARIDYVVDCPSLGSAPSLQPQGQTNFRQDLLQGTTFDWLERVGMGEGNPILVFKVKR